MIAKLDFTKFCLVFLNFINICSFEAFYLRLHNIGSHMLLLILAATNPPFIQVLINYFHEFDSFFAM